ncbi:hypothetical protein [Paenibacillus sp. y28]|uniref:hypothetical protein n=1 Tax=Paenibacillus sp. y28 TaxID=3129110 RepID=UPI003019EC54
MGIVKRSFIVMLLLQLVWSGLSLYQPGTASASTINAPSVVLLDEDFTRYADKTEATSLGYGFVAPTSGTGRASTDGTSGMLINVSGGADTAFTKIEKVFDQPQKGLVSVETTFRQSVYKEANIINLVDSNGTVIATAGFKPSKTSNKGFASSNGTDYVAITPNAPYNYDSTTFDSSSRITLRLELNTITRLYNVYVNDMLAISRARAAYYSTRGIHMDVAKVQVGSPVGSGDLRVTKLKVVSTPLDSVNGYTPAGPDFAYWVGRNQEVALYYESLTSASIYRIYVLNPETNEWFFDRQNTQNSQVRSLEKHSAVNYKTGTKMANGTTYTIGIATVARNEFNGTVYESEKTVIQATPSASIILSTSEYSVIKDMTVNETYNGAEWIVDSEEGIKVGDTAFVGGDYKIESVPEKYSSMERIIPSIKSQNYNESAVATFNVKDKATAYIAMDSRAVAASLPSNWLLATWTDTNDIIEVGDGVYTIPFKVYKKDFAANGLVTLERNTLAEINAKTSIGYFAFVQRSPVGLSLQSALPQWTNQASLPVTGVVSEANVQLTVNVNGSSVIDKALTGMSVDENIELTPGVNEIEILAKRTGLSVGDRIAATVNYDPDAPVLNITEPSIMTKQPVLMLQGTVNEDVWVTVQNNGTTVIDAVYSLAVSGLELPVPLSEGTNEIKVTALDAAGNETTKNYTVEYVFWADQPEFYDLAGSPLQTLTATGTIIARQEIINTTDTQKTLSLFTVMYDSNGKMVDYAIITAEFAPQSTKTLSAGFVLPDQVNGYKLKAYIWDHVNSMKPLSNESALQ